MEDSGAILAHISSLKGSGILSYAFPSLLIITGLELSSRKQVNEEIEASIQIAREIESSIVKCEEIEAELIKTSAMLQFDTVTALEVLIQRRNWENEKLLKDINDLKTTLLSAIGNSDGIQFRQL